MDLRIPGKAIEVLQELRALDSSTTIIVLTGYGSIPTAMKKGGDVSFTKPADADQILAVYESVRSSIAESSAPETVPSLARVEWEHMQRVMEDCGGNISQAARLLGIHRRSLQRKLAEVSSDKVTSCNNLPRLRHRFDTLFKKGIRAPI